MDSTMKSVSSPRSRRAGLLKHQLHLVKRRDCDRYEISPIEEPLSFEKGLFIFIRACQLLTQKMEGVIMVGLAGPSGAGKTVFSEKLVGFMPGISIVSMDNYNDSSRVIDGNYDDPRLTDYDLLLENLNDLRAGKDVEIPTYDFKSSQRVGYRTLKVPSSRIIVIEGIYALCEKLRPLLDLRVAVRGGVHFDLLKRVLRDINRAGQDPEEIIHQISETVYPMYKAFIEPDLETAHIKIVNKFNPFSGFQNPTYILKSPRIVTEEQIRQVLSSNHVEVCEETYDIYLLPPGEDPETCQSYLRMRNRDGKYSLMFEEVVMDDPFIISPRITFEVSVRLLGGLMALGYTIVTILKRMSQVFYDEKLCIKIDKLEQLERKYVQVQGKDRAVVAEAAKTMGLDGSYIPHSYIEQIQLEKLISGLMAPSEDLKSKLSLHEDALSPRVPNDLATSRKNGSKNPYSKSLSWTRDQTKGFSSSLPISHGSSQHQQRKFVKPELSLLKGNGTCFEDKPLNSPATYPGEEGFSQLLEKLSKLNERLEDILSRLGDLETKLATVSTMSRTPSHQNMSLQVSTMGRSLSHKNIALQGGSVAHGNGYANGPASAVGVLNAADPMLLEEVIDLGRGQRHLTQQLDMISGCLRDSLNERERQSKADTEGLLDCVLGRKTMYSKATLGLGILSLGFMLGAMGARAFYNK
ncbi:hypothetical protein GOP47_0011501 [Adiantum capillus-veneris]|uniref:CYTH domain-containing protein n=1 Tax=Adiantum capillus-veneris TaxID=13818 RepID=A0A9D4UUB9_ADICA|nr:hypothetical protein GOP47_0011501 [Adiantum capillus-veneris]